MDRLNIAKNKRVCSNLYNNPIILSICVATYNREHLLERLLSSVWCNNDRPKWISVIEWVIIDDGSSDKTNIVASRWSDRMIIKYAYQDNCGRAKALKKAVLLATGQYTVIMDSDDYFCANGLNSIMHELNCMKAETNTKTRPLIGILFGTKIKSKSNSADRSNLPSREIRTNFVAARADFGCSGDLKEVVETKILQEVCREIDFDVRRMPTYLWWAKVSMYGDCRMIKKIVAIKEYMQDGMTANIFRLKMESPEPMTDLYKFLSKEHLYNSSLYRLRSKLQWYRFALHSGNITNFSLIDRIILFPAFVVYIIDRMRLAGMAHRK
jgi:glycosyltransferase involved in cell wall biosynthesis